MGALQPETVNEYSKTILQTVGGLVVAFGLYLTWRRIKATEGQLRVSEEGLITDRFSKAVDQLASEDLAVRLGGIYPLERIARDSPKDHPTVLEVLSAFIREKSPLQNDSENPLRDPNEVETEGIKPAGDIQAILTVIGRRNTEYDNVQIDLSMTDLRGVNLFKANMEKIFLLETNFERAKIRKANFQHAYLVRAKLTRANLEETDLSGASLQGSILLNAKLYKANLKDCKLRGAKFTSTNLSDADLSGADMKETDLRMANLEGAILKGTNLLNPKVTEKQLKVAKDLTDVILPSVAVNTTTNDSDSNEENDAD